MKVVSLLDNLSCSKEIKHKWGMSLYIETERKKILFDVGSDDKFLKNAAHLGIDISAVDALIISHGHRDHGGGIKHFLKVNKKAQVYLKSTAFDLHYYKAFLVKLNVSLDDRPLKKFEDRIVLLNGDFALDEDTFLLGTLETANFDKRSFVDNDGGYAPDNFCHELALAVGDGERYNLFTGCTHNGLLPILDAVGQKQLLPIANVIGGLHLTGGLFGRVTKKQSELEQIADAVKQKVSGKLYTCHCTGKKGYTKLSTLLGDKVAYLKGGDSVTL